MKYGVVETACFPHSWYAGPVDFEGQPMDNATCNYYRDEEQANIAVEKHNQCDGCKQGLPVRDGIHYKDDVAVMTCERNLYIKD